MSRSEGSPAPQYRSPKLFLLLFRLEVLTIAAILAAAGFAAAGVLNDTVAPWLFAVAAALGEGFLLGGSSRLFFRRFSVQLQWAAGLAATVVSVVILGWLTRGLAGVDPNGAMTRQPDWMGLVQALIGGIAATSAAAWGRIRYPPPKPKAAAEATEAAGGMIKTGTPKETRPVRERLANALRFLRRSNHDAEIRLVGAEEHKCPYCLQVISPRDPRGVVTCPICKTRHHKDCWDITGMCQVPHYHS